MASTALKNADFLRAVELPHISEKCYWAVAYWNECLLAVARPAAAHRSSSLGRTSECNRASGETFLSLIKLNIFPWNSMGKRLCWIVGWRGEKGGEENVRAEELQPQAGALEEVLPTQPLPLWRPGHLGGAALAPGGGNPGFPLLEWDSLRPRAKNFSTVFIRPV